MKLDCRVELVSHETCCARDYDGNATCCLLLLLLSSLEIGSTTTTTFLFCRCLTLWALRALCDQDWRNEVNKICTTNAEYTNTTTRGNAASFDVCVSRQEARKKRRAEGDYRPTRIDWKNKKKEKLFIRHVMFSTACSDVSSRRWFHQDQSVGASVRDLCVSVQPTGRISNLLCRCSFHGWQTVTSGIHSRIIPSSSSKFSLISD